MELKQINIAQADQLSDCKVSLLLGVSTPQNLIHDFLRTTRAILQSKATILHIHGEPYIWHDCAAGFKAFQVPDDFDLAIHFDRAAVLAESHPNYQKISHYLLSLGFQHQQLLAFDFKADQMQSFGQLMVFEGSEKASNLLENLQLIQDLAQALGRNAELRSKDDELKGLYEQQCALNFSKTNFFQIIAHDLRAPFHGILGFSEILVEEINSLDQVAIQNIAGYLHETAQSTFDLLENLLGWAIAEGGRMVIHPTNFPLKQSSKIVYDVLNSLAMKKNIELIDTVTENLKVYADINMVTSVIQNLVSNALKFTQVDGTGKVYIYAQQNAENVEIYVRDTGVGMTESQMISMFQPNIKISLKGTSGEKGLGLGLVLCKRFVDMNQGQLMVTSQQGQGTTVKVVLPSAMSTHQALLAH